MDLRAKLLALILTFTVAGCATTGRAGEELHLASLELSDSLQFGDYRVIAQRLPAELRNEFLARAYGIEKSLSILEMTTISTTLEPDGSRAQSLIRMSWYELPSTIVKTDNVFVDWTRTGSGTNKSWQIERVSGGPLPIPEE